MEKRKLRIGIDIDEVLAEHLEQLINFCEKEKNILIKRDDFFTYYWPDVLKISLEEAIKLDEEFKESEFFENILPLENSTDIINDLKNNHELFVITARPNKFENKTKKWLENNFENSFNEIIHTEDPYGIERGNNRTKCEICLEKYIDFLIEDNSKTSLDCAKKGVKVFLIDNPWNQNCEHENIIRVKNWKEIKEKIGELNNGIY
jgi:hypothetical protein